MMDRDELNSLTEDSEQENNKKLRALELAVKRANATRKYDEKVKSMAVALVNDGYSYAEVCNILNVKSKGTIANWVDQYAMSALGDSEKELLERYKRGLQTKFMRNADVLVQEAMREDKIEKASTLQLVTASGIMIDKAEKLEKGDQSPFNINIAVNSISRSTGEIEALEANEAELMRELERFHGDVIDV